MLAAPFRRIYLVGVIDDPSAAERAAQALRGGGVAGEDVVLRTGSEISDRLEKEDPGNLVREATTEEGRSAGTTTSCPAAEPFALRKRPLRTR